MSFKSDLRKIVEDNSSKKGKYFDYVIQSFILLSLVTFSLETVPSLYSEYTYQFELIEKIIVIVFSFEYLLRVYVAKNPFKYIFSFYGIIDLLSTLPFYLRLTFDLRFIRIFRVFRIFRALKLIKYNKALQRFSIAFKLVKEELMLFFIVTVILIYISGSGMYFFENEVQPETFKTVFHSFWWAVVTLTTVGYGDVIPITVGGRILTFFILMLGIGIVTVPAGIFSSSLSKARELTEEN